jgi:predicted permease
MIATLREVLARLASFLRKQARDEDFDQEMAAHVEFAVEENMRRGLPPDEARRRALIEIGGVSQARELHRESHGLPLLDTVIQDLQYAGRMLKRDAGLTAFAILMVGLGVGASCTVFSVLNAILIRPLPFTDPDRLVWITNGTSGTLSRQATQVANLIDFQAQSGSFSGIGGYSPFYGAGDILLSGSGEPERLTGVPVTEAFFPLLGLKPRLGRFFSAEECRWKAPKTVVLSNGFWQRRFAADPDVIGRQLILDGEPTTIIGVLPAIFDFAATFTPGSRADLFYPFPLTPETNSRGNTLALIGRLREGANLNTAQAEATVVGERIRRAVALDRSRNGFLPKLSSLRDRVSGRFRYALVVLAGAVAFLMLLVCANLSNLLLARASARQREMAIRTALGAGRGRLVRQMLVESIVLASAGAALGLALAVGGTTLLARLSGANIPLLQSVRVDGVALAFTLSISVLTGIVFGLAPALQASATAPIDALKESGRGLIGGGRGWMRGSLVVCEIALAAVLLTGAGLLTESLIRVLRVDLGFATGNLLALRADPGKAYTSHAQRLEYFDRLLRAVRSVHGVESAGITDALPLGENFGWRDWGLGAKGQIYEKGKRPSPLIRIVDDGYLATMRIPLRAGRGFINADNLTSERVVLVNEAFARTLWPGEDPLGRIITPTLGLDQEYRVIGVVGGVRYFGFEKDAGLEVYFPIRQTDNFSSVDLVVRGSGSPAVLAADVRTALRAADPNLPAAEFRTMDELVDRAVFARRSVVVLLIGFAAFGLILASLGIFSVISHSVSRRKPEIGLRIALGASAGELQAQILMQTLKLDAIGLAAGVPASWAAALAIRGLLFDTSALDGVTFAGVLALLTCVAAVAGYVPARRASRLNPLETLRCD